MAYTVSTLRTHSRRTKPVGFFKMLVTWRTRQKLKDLDDRALADIGLTRADVKTEVNRPFWDVPATWRD